MSRPAQQAFQAANVDEISPLSSPHDDLNQQIVRLLQDDGRATYDEIGQKLGVSGGTVRNRVTRMRDAGMLRIVAVVDPVAVDYESDAMLGIKAAAGVAPTADRRSGSILTKPSSTSCGSAAGSTCWSRSCATRRPSSPTS